jgi:hypothetical protein
LIILRIVDNTNLMSSEKNTAVDMIYFFPPDLTILYRMNRISPEFWSMSRSTGITKAYLAAGGMVDDEGRSEIGITAGAGAVGRGFGSGCMLLSMRLESDLFSCASAMMGASI